jgi:hypothetical protein
MNILLLVRERAEFSVAVIMKENITRKYLCDVTILQSANFVRVYSVVSQKTIHIWTV